MIGVCAETQLGLTWGGVKYDLICEKEKLSCNCFIKMLNLANKYQYFQVGFFWLELYKRNPKALCGKMLVGKPQLEIILHTVHLCSQLCLGFGT